MLQFFIYSNTKLLYYACIIYQDRLETIVEQMKALGSQHEDIKLQLQQENNLQNFQIVNQLQNELDLISTKQMQLINEQSELTKHLRRYEKFVLIYYRIPINRFLITIISQLEKIKILIMFIKYND